MNPSPAETTNRISRPPENVVSRSLGIYLGTLLALTALAWGSFFIMGPVQHKMHLHSSLFCCSGFQFSDFLDLSARVAHFGEPNLLDPARFRTPYAYPVPTIYAYLLFVRLFPHPLVAYLLFVIIAFVLATSYLSIYVRRLTRKRLPQITVWATLLLGFPLLFLLDRGNIEAFIWVLVLLGLTAFTRNRPLLASVLWALAASMKIFPAILFLLFLARRRYWMFAAAVGFAVLFSVLALAGVGPSVHQAALASSKNAPFMINNYILIRNLPQFDHSFFSAIKQAAQLFLDLSGRGPKAHEAFKVAVQIYNVAALFGFLLLYWFRLRKLPQLNQFMAYMLLAILLPYISNEYTLVYVFLVLAAFLIFLLQDFATGRVALPARTVGDILFSCAIVFVPLTYFGIPTGTEHVIMVGAQIKTVFLLIILFAVIRHPMPSSLFGDLTDSMEDRSAALS